MAMYGSLPSIGISRKTVLTSGQRHHIDRLTGRRSHRTASTLRHSEIAEDGDRVDRIPCRRSQRYDMHAFVVNAGTLVHLLLTPQVVLPRLTRTLKSFTAKRANQALGLTGRPFWQEESYDRLVRKPEEFDRDRYYIEQNPVRAGLVKDASDYPWSSAGRGRQFVSGAAAG